MPEFKLPDVGEGLTEAEIISWQVSVGDTVAINDVLVEIETAKSLVELPSPYAGEVRALLVSEGDTVLVGTPIIAIGSADVVEDAPAEAPPSTEPAKREAMLVGYGPRTDAPARRRRPSAPPARVASVDTERVRQPAPPTPPAPQPATSGLKLRPLAKPPVRKLAKDLGVDLADVPTTGDVVTRADVEAFAGRTESASAPMPVPQDDAGETRIPIKGVRKLTAEAMVRSAFTAPHVTEWVTLDVSRTMELVARLKSDRAFADVKVSPTLIAAKAICLAMRRTPELNARWDEAGQEIVVKKAVNLGIAAATARGLVVPNIVGADSLSLVELAAAIGELTTTAREGRTQPAQMAGGTFSLTNIGVFGIDAGTPILNPGESGILALGSIERRPWVDQEDRVVPRWVTTLALSFDHRVVDGEQGSRFLADVAAILRDPATALTY
ncbi:MAG: dihydrolipoamide acetyltransferase family protein [Aeromicrobium sp.]